MKKTLIALALAAAPFVSFASESNGIGHTYVQLDAIYQDADGLYPYGAGLSGSYAFTDTFFATASYASTRDNDFNADPYSPRYYDTYNEHYRQTNWSLGVGFNQSLGSRADWVTQLSYVNSSTTMRFEDDYYYYRARTRSSGYNISTGVLGRLTDKLNANAYLGYEDFNHNYDGDFYAAFDMVYAFNKTWGLHGGVKLNDGMETYTVGVRASF
ncbi:hypothetical protein [Lysobacter sp. FW306-1B-D06B]|uniref:hypothetical protein n=1 Tax=Lysobacter sp. FW306-1B-D06B TaxID=3140250 RepID=UPI003140A0C7